MTRTLSALFVGMFALATPCAAQDDFKPDPGFRSLFNGKDLTGWKLKGNKDDLTGKTETANKRFTVVKGAIFVNSGGGDLYTTENFDSDFVAKMEYRAGLKADSGVFIRGPQLQIRDFKRRNEQKYLTKYKDDDWNVLVITVKGTEATYTLNDEPLKNPDKMKVPASGGLGLQSETGTFEYRRIQIKTDGKAKAERAPQSDPTFVAAVQPDFKPAAGFRSLFNGKDMTGWHYKQTKEKLDGKTESADKRFLVKDGVIVCDEGKGIKDLYTNEEFDQEFILKVQFRAAAKADSGVYVRGNQLQVRDFIRRGEMKGKLTKFKNDDWNELEITVRNKVTTFNGKVLTPADQLSVTVKDGVPTATLNGKPVPVANINVSHGPVAHCFCNGEFMEDMKVPAKGGIGLQAETGKFEFRHVQIKLLDGAKSAQLLPATQETFVSAAGEPKKRLLLVTESKGFVHSVVNRNKKDMCLVEKTFIELAQKFPFFEVEYTQDSRSAITAENLKKFDAVFFYTTGELPLSDAQKSDLLAFVRSGKGFGGSHCATDTFYKWKEYGEMIGAYFDGHPWHTKVTVVVEDKKHISTRHLGDSFEITDEIYQFKAPYGRDKLHVLMRLEHQWATAARLKELKDIEEAKRTLPEKLAKLEKEGKLAEAKKLKAQVEGRKPGIHRTDDDHALAWINQYGKGRVFYTALGHREEVWQDPRFQQHVIGGLRHIFGMEK